MSQSVFHYREFAPAASLVGRVECVWTMRAERTGPYRVLPDGCIDLLFDLAGSRGATLVGAMTRPLTFEVSRGAWFLGVRFRPGQVGAFAKLCAAELTDAEAPLGDWWGDAGELLERLAGCTAEATAAALAGAWLERKARRENEATRLFVRAAVARIEAAGGDVRVDALAAGLGCTRHHLAREFARTVGLTPKQLARIVRLRAFVRRRGRGETLARVAAELGFADEAHLARECRLLAGLTPGALVGQAGAA